jgi:hypothetical protein
MMGHITAIHLEINLRQPVTLLSYVAAPRTSMARPMLSRE